MNGKTLIRSQIANAPSFTLTFIQSAIGKTRIIQLSLSDPTRCSSLILASFPSAFAQLQFWSLNTPRAQKQFAFAEARAKNHGLISPQSESTHKRGHFPICVLLFQCTFASFIDSTFSLNYSREVIEEVAIRTSRCECCGSCLKL